MGETSAPYNEYCLPVCRDYDLTICTYFNPSIHVPKEITLFEGDNSLRGFYRALQSALAHKHYDIIDAHAPHSAFLFWIANLVSPKKSAAATVYTVHSSFPNYKARHKLMLMPVFASFNRVVCCSDASLRSFTDFYKRLAGDRLCVIRNGVNVDRIDRIVGSRRTYLYDSHFNIAMLGRLIEVKNPLAVLHAFRAAADSTSRLVVIGEGHLRERLVKETSSSGLVDRVEMTGLIPRAEVYRHLARMNLLISASRVEGLPIAVLEAMACRCPVLLSDIPSHREIADGAEFIPLIPCDDIAGFAREIKRFKGMSFAERADIGERCRNLVEERFSLAVMHQLYKKIFVQLIEELQRGKTNVQPDGGWRES